MDPWFKWARSKLAVFLFVYWGSIVLLTLGLEWIDQHQVAFGIASLIVAMSVMALLVIRWRGRRYW